MWDREIFPRIAQRFKGYVKNGRSLMRIKCQDARKKLLKMLKGTHAARREHAKLPKSGGTSQKRVLACPRINPIKLLLVNAGAERMARRDGAGSSEWPHQEAKEFRHSKWLKPQPLLGCSALAKKLNPTYQLATLGADAFLDLKSLPRGH